MKIKTATHTVDSRKVRKTLCKAWKVHQKLNKRYGQDMNGNRAIQILLSHMDILKNRPGYYQRNMVL